MKSSRTAVDVGPRFFVVSESNGLVGTVDSQDEADDLALGAAVITAHTVYVHDRLEELARG